MLNRLVRWSRIKSPWILHLNSGACNACDIEIVAALTPRFDVERLGVLLKATPRHADVIVCTGPVTRQIKDRIIRIYEQVPDPKFVVAVGACAMSGCVYRGAYNVEGGHRPGHPRGRLRPRLPGPAGRHPGRRRQAPRKTLSLEVDMKDTEIIERIQGLLGARVLAITNPSERRIFLTVAPAALPDSVRALRDGLGFAYLATISGVDKGEAFELLYHFANAHTCLTVRTEIPRSAPRVPVHHPGHPRGHPLRA